MDWGLEISPFLIEPSCANGVGVLRLKETHIGSLLLVRSMGLKEEDGALAGLGRALGRALEGNQQGRFVTAQ